MASRSRRDMRIGFHAGMEVVPPIFCDVLLLRGNWAGGFLENVEEDKEIARSTVQDSVQPAAILTAQFPQFAFNLRGVGKCNRLITAIEQGNVLAWTSPLVIAEIIFVLESPKTYNIARETLRTQLLPLLGLANLRLERKQLYPRIFALYVSYPIDYIDAYHTAMLEQYHQHDLFSFDRDFDALPGLTRREPE